MLIRRRALSSSRAWLRIRRSHALAVDGVPFRPQRAVTRREPRNGQVVNSWSSRRISGRSVSKEALARFGKPEIFNTDQGSQFTSTAFTGMLTVAGLRISVDGRGRWMDNVFVERLWRSLKHEDIYLKGYADGREAKAGIAFYNVSRPHQALGNRTPMAVGARARPATSAIRLWI
jgi:transposase InsO family protein